MSSKQRTISTTTAFKGLGIHSGKIVTLNCYPADINNGICFVRTDLNNAEVRVSSETVIAESRFTKLSQNGVNIHTPEHILSACAGLGITNLRVEIDAEEVPILDGSALTFCDEFNAAGVKTQDAELLPIIIKDAFKITGKDGAYIEVSPAETFSYTYTLDYPTSFVGKQSATYTQAINYISDIAPARTYGFEAEVKALLARGLAKGGSLDNAVVIGENDYLNPLRFDNELARHKLLDLIGDMWIIGRPVIGNINAFKSGHALNAALVSWLGME